MIRSFTKIIVVVLSMVLIFGTVGPIYADAQTNKNESKLLERQTNTLINNKNRINPTKIQPEPTGIKTQAVKAALKYGGSALGNLLKKIPYSWAKKAGTSIEKYGYKAANVLDDLTSFGESSVTLALTGAGIPPNDAALIAKFIVFFLG